MEVKIQDEPYFIKRDGYGGAYYYLCIEDGEEVDFFKLPEAFSRFLPLDDFWLAHIGLEKQHDTLAEYEQHKDLLEKYEVRDGV